MPTNIYQRAAMAAAIAACFPATGLAAGVARVDFASGSVSATTPDGRMRPLSKGSEVEVGETVATQQGRAQLRFADGAYMSLQPQTEFKVEEFKYSGKAEPTDNIVMNLIKGGMRTITGLIGRTNRNAYRLKTEVATIGIRGTEYSVRYTNSIELHVTDGIVSVDNQSGSFTVPGGTNVIVSNQQTPPQQTDQKPVLPPEGPLFKDEQKLTEHVPPPVNPFQESQQASTLLTGTITASYAYISESSPFVFNPFSEASMNPVTLDANGVLTSFLDFDSGSVIGSGSATIASDGNDGVVAWGRWSAGSLTQDGSPVVSSTPFHYVVGIPATNIPLSDTATYTIIGATVPTTAGSWTSAGVVDSFVKVNFGTGASSFHASFDINGNPVSTFSNGVALTLSSGKFNGGFTSSLSGLSCGQLAVTGALMGDGAVRAGMAYHISEFGNSAYGTIAYTKSGP
jgi:hypothetical protein